MPLLLSLSVFVLFTTIEICACICYYLAACCTATFNVCLPTEGIPLAAASFIKKNKDLVASRHRYTQTNNCMLGVCLRLPTNIQWYSLAITEKITFGPVFRNLVLKVKLCNSPSTISPVVESWKRWQNNQNKWQTVAKKILITFALLLFQFSLKYIVIYENCCSGCFLFSVL